MATDDERAVFGCFGLILLLGIISYGFIGWLLYELVVWITSK